MVSSKVEIKEEALKDCLDEMKPIFDLHWDEVAIHKENIKLNPDYDRYLQMANDGSIKAYIARENGKLIGYAIFIISYNLHYKDHVYAHNDIVYLSKDYRGSGLAVELFQIAELKLKENYNVDVINVSMKVALPFDDLMKYLGFEYIERTYSKFIGD
jgi:GNAT superfamily N-acetyltransferase